MHMSEGMICVSFSLYSINWEQKIGKKLKVISLNLSVITMKQVLFKGYKSLNILC